MTSAQPTSPTPYEAVNTLRLMSLAKVQTILCEKLVGFYLYGSLSLGDGGPRSRNVDFLMMTMEDLSGKVLKELQDMHAGIASNGFLSASRLEGSSLACAALR